MTDIILLEAAYQNTKLALAPTLCKQMTTEQLHKAISNPDNEEALIDIFLEELSKRNKNQ